MEWPSLVKRSREGPDNPVTAKSLASEEEAKTIKDVVNLAQQLHNQDRNEFDEPLERNNLRRALRAHAWKRSGPLCVGSAVVL